MNDLLKGVIKIDKGVNKRFPGRAISLPKNVDIAMEWLPVADVLLSILQKRMKKLVAQLVLFVSIAELISNAIVNILKDCVDRRRPGLRLKYNSFPSRHTAISFCGAEIICLQEDSNYSKIIGFYLVAITTAALRIRRKKHWFSDVVAGAIIGIISARFSYKIIRRIYNL